LAGCDGVEPSPLLTVERYSKPLNLQGLHIPYSLADLKRIELSPFSQWVGIRSRLAPSAPKILKTYVPVYVQFAIYVADMRPDSGPQTNQD
jgi:hypothetical protein